MQPKYDSVKINRILQKGVDDNNFLVYFTLMASLPVNRLCLSWSLKIKKGLPYSSKAKLPTDCAILKMLQNVGMF